MPKPRTKGPTIQFRLPLALHDKLTAEATRLGTEPNDLAAAMVTGSLETYVDEPIRRPVTAKTATGVDALCSHTKTTVISGGLKRCNDCGAVANPKGEWTLP